MLAQTLILSAIVISLTVAQSELLMFAIHAVLWVVRMRVFI